MRTPVTVMTMVATLCAAPPLAAQPAPRAPITRVPADQMRALRHQIATMEGVLERAVQHGATLTRDRLRAVLPPSDLLLTEPARVRGFRIEGYGVFFDVEVPSLEPTLLWSFQTLNRNDLGLDTALRTLRDVLDKSGDSDAQQALKRLELQVAPAAAAGTELKADPVAGTPPPGAGDARLVAAAGQGQVVSGPGTPPQANTSPDTILDDPENAYRQEVVDALIDAVLDHSRGLNVAAAEWLHLGARRNDDRVILARANSDISTIQIRARGGDLAAYLIGRITKDEARQRIEVKVF